jgi:hypothetical protein
MGELLVKQDYFTELDRRDQQQIIMEATGEVSKELFYDVGGKKGLSYRGVNTTAFFMGDIQTEPGVEWEKIEMGGRLYWSATVRAVNLTFNLAALGMAEVPEMMEVHDVDENKKWVKNTDGSWKMHLEFDRFCRRKAIGMAQRNAKSAVMPTGILEAFLKYYIRRAAGEKDLEPPFNPKKIPADYRVLPENGGKDEGKRKTSTTPKKTPEPKLPAKKLAKDVVEYNLKALDPNYLEVLEVVEYEAELMIAAKPGIALPDADQYKIDSILQSLGAIWTDNRYWRIPRH